MIPQNTIQVAMDVKFLYSNIKHVEGKMILTENLCNRIFIKEQSTKTIMILMHKHEIILTQLLHNHILPYKCENLNIYHEIDNYCLFYSRYINEIQFT